jgi:hypothetical protein
MSAMKRARRRRSWSGTGEGMRNIIIATTCSVAIEVWNELGRDTGAADNLKQTATI